MDEIIDIVDVTGNPTGSTILKSIAHKEGILHRVVHAHFFDREGYIYFQRRHTSKAHFPGMLHYAIGGHIKTGEVVVDALIREGEEEIGIILDKEKIILVDIFHQKVDYPEYNLKDNEIAFDYIYEFDGNISNLQFNDGEVESFEKIPINQLINVSYEDFKNHNIVSYKFYPNIFKKIKEILEN